MDNLQEIYAEYKTIAKDKSNNTNDAIWNLRIGNKNRYFSKKRVPIAQ